MTSPTDENRYDILETDQFDAEWRRAVRLGHINPMADPANLMQIKEWLARNPYRTRTISGAHANTRRAMLNPRVWLWYSIIEDDRVVWLESVRIVGDN